MCWYKLIIKKENGGMRFKNLHAFNLSMLGNRVEISYLTLML